MVDSTEDCKYKPCTDHATESRVPYECAIYVQIDDQYKENTYQHITDVYVTNLYTSTSTANTLLTNILISAVSGAKKHTSVGFGQQ